MMARRTVFSWWEPTEHITNTDTAKLTCMIPAGRRHIADKKSEMSLFAGGCRPSWASRSGSETMPTRDWICMELLTSTSTLAPETHFKGGQLNPMTKRKKTSLSKQSNTPQALLTGLSEDTMWLSRTSSPSCVCYAWRGVIALKK